MILKTLFLSSKNIKKSNFEKKLLLRIFEKTNFNLDKARQPK